MISWRGAVGGVVALSAALGTALVWRDDPDKPAAAVAIADGADLFTAKGCSGCHSGPGQVSQTDPVIDLSAAPDWAGDRREGYSAEEYIAESIHDPGAFTSPEFSTRHGPVDAMPYLTVSDAEVEALTDYLLQR